jgi:hypothetical protein
MTCLLLSFNSSTCQRHGQIGMVAQTTLLSSPSQGRSPLASQSMQNISENEVLQYQLRATSCPRGNKCSLGTSTRGPHRSLEHQGQRTQETSAIYCPDMYQPCSQSTRGWNSQGLDVRASYKDI